MSSVIIYVMELHEANRILRSVKAALYADGVKLPPSAETDGLMMLLGKLDQNKFLMPKIRHARTLAPQSTAYARSYAYIAFFRALTALTNNIQDPVTSLSCMLLHKNICGDIDADAGKPRGTEATTDGNAHTDPKYISGSLKSIIAKMNDIESAPTIGREDFAGYLTHYMRELIILHPFERGSEFTVRIFMMLFCKLKGFSLCFYRAPAAQIRQAEKAAFISDDVSPLYKLLLTCLSYEHTVAIPKQKPSVKTRRELASKTRVSPDTDSQSEIDAVKLKALEKPDAEADGEVLKRAIKLQQKISKLNEQLTELMSQTEKTDD